MQIKKLDHVGIRVMDVDQSIAFYKTLGFQVTREDHKEQVFVVKHPSGIEINLIAHGNDDYGRKNVLMDVAEKYPGYTHYAIAVASVEEAKAFFESINIKITGGPITFGDGKTSIFIRDPDLNVIEFTELPQDTASPLKRPDSSAYGFAQNAIVPAGSNLVYIAGQGSDTTGPNNTYPDSFSEQMERAFANLRQALTAVGATPEDVVKITILSVNHTDEKLQLISAARRAFWPNKKPTSTLIPVPRLASSGMLFEIDAVAMISSSEYPKN